LVAVVREFVVVDGTGVVKEIDDLGDEHASKPNNAIPPKSKAVRLIKSLLDRAIYGFSII
jgi:hypothetical protein